MELSRFEGFYWVGRTGGYASAARAMPRAISQPAIYQQVKRLEDDCGIDLRSPGFPAELTDEEPEQGGAEVIVRGRNPD